MAYTFTLTNAKGGCGKTTTALNLAICFAKAGYRTLAIDLGQGDNSATRDLLKQYVPLNGIVTKPEPEIRHEMPVENCLASRAIVAPRATLAPRASLAPHATVARGATIKNDDDDIKIKKIIIKGRRNRNWRRACGKPHLRGCAARERNDEFSARARSV
jgi:hypothetical protein